VHIEHLRGIIWHLVLLLLLVSTKDNQVDVRGVVDHGQPRLMVGLDEVFGVPSHGVRLEYRASSAIAENGVLESMIRQSYSRHLGEWYSGQ
jgi:hypothetical protein